MRKRHKNSIFTTKNVVGFFFVLLMISSVLAIWQGSAPVESAIPAYNGYDISYAGNMYVIDAVVGDAYGYTHPDSLTYLPYDAAAVAALGAAPQITILFSPEDENIAVIEVLRKDLAERDFALLGTSVTFGLLEDSDAYPYTVASCSDFAGNALVLETNVDEQTSIFTRDGCVVASGQTPGDIVRVRDRLVYGLYGIIA